MGAEWALNNPTHTDMNSWFHYAKVYAATAGCIGFMALKYNWGKTGPSSHWFKCFPFVIVAINILIAVVSDFESAVRALRHHAGFPPRASRSTAAGTTCSTASRACSNIFVHDRLVRHLRVQEAARTCCGPT